MFITLGVEDALSQAVATRLVEQYAEEARILEIVGLAGNDDLRKRLPSLNAVSSFVGPALVLTDLDRPEICPAELVMEWTRNMNRHPNLLIRVAVLEVEAWLIADRVNLARWLSVALNVIPRAPESIDGPKRFLVQMARRSRSRTLREGIVRDRGNGLFQPGPDYNAQLIEFVNDHWNPETARLAAPNLDRAIRRISNLPSETETIP